MRRFSKGKTTAIKAPAIAKTARMFISILFRVAYSKQLTRSNSTRFDGIDRQVSQNRVGVLIEANDASAKLSSESTRNGTIDANGKPEVGSNRVVVSERMADLGLVNSNVDVEHAGTCEGGASEKLAVGARAELTNVG